MRRRRIVRIASSLLIGIATAAAVMGKDYVLVRNFHVVEPGQVFRGAEQKPIPFSSIIRRHGIRTVLCLAEPEWDERAAAESMGVRGQRVERPDDLAGALKDAIAHPGPSLVEVVVDGSIPGPH